MNYTELYYRLALSQVNGIGPIKYKKLIQQYESAENVFKLKKKNLKNSGLLSEANIDALLSFTDFTAIENELKYNQKHDITIHCFDEDSYPSKLKNCVDAPVLLFQKGDTNINNSRMLSVIGTRTFTEYGRKMCEELIENLKSYNATIVSGLAYGIDIIAHKACIKNNIPTIGVMAHGLKYCYPPTHLQVANEMQKNGALLSEYFSSEELIKSNFPTRNRIVAGMSDATIVIETDIKGGSMITAEIAFSYNREVFCYPGKTTDNKSAGCNFLIKKLKASLCTSADDIAYELGWKLAAKQKPIQKELFIEMTDDEKIIVKIIREKNNIHIDALCHLSNLSSTQMASAMLNLEMQQIIQVMPGKMISMCG